MLASLIGIHLGWAYVVIAGNGLAGAWALAAEWAPSFRTRSLWWFTAFAEGAVFLQVALGVGLLVGQHRQVDAFHPFYGFLAIVVVGLAYAYRRQVSHRLYLLYGLGGLFLMGVAVRALITAKG